MAGTASISWTNSIDVDAQAFLTAADITDITIVNAINGLVMNAKRNNWWSLCQAIYPMVGGTASTHKWNLKDVRDLDAAFRLVFGGTWTHSSTGALPNGTSGIANTYYVPTTNATAGSNHMSYYSRTQGTSGDAMVEMGSQGTSFIENQILVRYLDNMYLEPNSVQNGFLTAANTDARGYFIASRTSNTAIIGQKNTTQITGSHTEALNSYSIYLGARNKRGVGNLFSNRECAFATIGSGLTPSIQIAMYVDVQQFQTTLGRQV